MQEVREGRVKFFRPQQCFGFIIPGGSSQPVDVFFWKKKGHVLTYENGEPVWTKKPLRDPRKNDRLFFILEYDSNTGQPKAEKWAFKDARDSDVQPRPSVRIFVQS